MANIPTAPESGATPQRENSHESILGNTGRDLGGTRGGQIFVAILIASFFATLAWLAWTNRNLAAQVFAVYLVFRGLAFASRALPGHPARDARRREDEEIMEQCPANFGRMFIWICAGALAVNLWRQRDLPTDLIVPGLGFAAGIICEVICRRYLKKARASRAIPSLAES